MEGQILINPQIIPSEEVLDNALSSSYDAYKSLIDTITKPPFEFVPEWRYYKDGGAWLCKVQCKKKTVFWLSAWDGYFKTTFYFTEKNCSGLADLKINEKTLKDFAANKPIGKLLPLTLLIERKEHLTDLFKLAEYKKKQK